MRIRHQAEKQSELEKANNRPADVQMITIKDYENEETPREPIRTLGITRSKAGRAIIGEMRNEEEEVDVNEWWKQHKVRIQTQKMLVDEQEKEKHKKLRHKEDIPEEKEENQAPEEGKKEKETKKQKFIKNLRCQEE